MSDLHASERAKDLDAATQAAMSGELGRACRLYEAAARTIVTAGGPDGHQRCDALVLRQPWFGFGCEELARALDSQATRACFMDPDMPLGEPLPGVTLESWRDLTHEGVCLWDVVRADFCVRHELSLGEVARAAGTHLPALAAEFGRAARLIDRALLYFDAFTPSRVLVAQGFVLASAVIRALAHARGLRVVAIENTLHAGRLLWDDAAALPVVHNPAGRDWWRWQDCVTTAAANATAETYLAELKSLKSAQHATPARSAPRIAGRGRTLVYLAQVATDSSVLFGIGAGFERQVDVLRAVAEHAAARGHQLVVKLHPKEREGCTPLGEPYARLTLRQMRADPVLAPMINSGALFVDSENEYDTYQLIDRADLCITINSQAGLEALLKGKELVLCGTAFYGGLGFTHKADDAATLAVCIDRALDAGLARNTSDAARRFFHVYLNHTCCEKTPHAIAELLAGGSRTATRESAVDAPRDDGYASGERQTALHYTEIRRDHQVRYEFAAEAIASVSGGARLSGIDAFCGNGYGTWWLAERTGASLVGIDACGEAIAVAEARYSNANTSFQELRFPFELPAARFDFVTCFESIEHVEDGARLLAELANALKPGGLLFLSTPNEAALPFRENADFFGFHFQHYAREELLDLAGSVGLAPRVELGQDVYRMQRRRACGTLEPRDMELREGAESPQFLLHVFERLTDVVAPEVTGARLDLRDVGDLDLTLAAESLDEVAVASLFERLTFVEGRHALAAWHRALVPGGRLELRVPDLRYHVDRYLEASAATTGRSRGNPRKDALAGLWGWQRSHGEVHESGYDFSMLRGLLSEHSFVDVVRLSAEPHELRVVCWKPMQSG